MLDGELRSGGQAQALAWLKPEVLAAAQRIRRAVEVQQDQEADAIAIKSALQEIRQIEGALELGELYGPAILANHIRITLQDVLLSAVEDAGEALAAVGTATLWLAAWVDGTQLNLPESAAVAQPLVAALCAARGKPAPTESDLFVRQMQGMAVLLAVPAEPVRADGAAVVVARKLLAPFQSLLLQWLKGQDAARVLLKLRKVAEQIAINAKQPATVMLWTACGAAIDSMLCTPGAESSELKRTFGRMSQHLKALAEHGETSSVDLSDTAWRLIANAANLGTQGEYWRSLFDGLPLASTLPLATTLQAQRQRLQGPDSTLIEHVGRETRRELTRIKDGIDLAVRAGALEGPVLASVREHLVSLASTLQLLRLNDEAQSLRTLAASALLNASQVEGDHPELLAVAELLLRVEQSLLASSGKAVLPAAALTHGPHPKELFRAKTALARELRVNLSRLKGILDAALKGSAPETDTEPIGLLNQSAAALVLGGATRAGEYVAHLASYLYRAGPKGFVQERAQAAVYAEAITLLELVLDDLAGGVSERWLNALGLRIERLSLEPAAAPELSLKPMAAEPIPAVVTATREPELPAPPQPSLDRPAAASAAAPAASDDPEIQAIFISEAREVCTALERALLTLRRDNAPQEALAIIRRGFHTLKGSGRMVGAKELGEAAWAVENLLNRCLDGALPINEAVHALLGQAIALLPRLLDQYQGGQGIETSAEAQQLVARANYLTSGRAPEMVEADVLAIFREDAYERLGALREWLEASAPRALGADAQRALHTLKGSAAAVHAAALSQLAGALEVLLDAVRASGEAVPEAVTTLLADALPVLRGGVGDAGSADTLPIADWLARIEPLKAVVGAGAGEAAQATRVAFSDVAFDRLQEIESTLVAWTAARHDTGLAARLSEQARRLAAQASQHGAGRLTTALQQLAAFAESPGSLAAGPDADQTGALGVLAARMEQLYRALDDYRMGGMGDEPAALASLLPDLPLGVGAGAVSPPAYAQGEDLGLLGMPRSFSLDTDFLPEPPAVLAEAGPLPVLAETAAVSLDLVVLPEPIVAAEPAPPPELAVAAEPAPPPELAVAAEPAPPPELAVAAEPAPPPEPAVAAEPAPPPEPAVAAEPAPSPEPAVAAEPAPPPGVSLAETIPEIPVPAPDTELQEVFNAEAGEHVAQLRANLAPLRLGGPQALAAVRQALHTFAGSAHMAGRHDTAVRLSTLLRTLEDSTGTAEELADVADQLQSVLQDLPVEMSDRGQPEPGEMPAIPPEAIAEQPAVAEASAAASERGLEVTAAAPPEPQEAVQPRPVEPIVLPLPPEFASMPTVPGDSVEGIDSDLAGIFAAEAAETLEFMDAALTNWRNGRQVEDAAQTLQRNLHTLKGGARILGFMHLGTLAHEMETRVDVLASRLNPPDASDFEELRVRIGELEQQHDALMRGHYSALLRATAPPDHRRTLVPAVVAPSAEPPRQADTPAPAVVVPAAIVPAYTAAALPWRPELFAAETEETPAAAPRELARVGVDVLDGLLKQAGEVSIVRARVEQQNNALTAQLAEVSRTVVRLREQLHQMVQETEAQIVARGYTGSGADGANKDFDPLELDRYTHMQEISRALSETVTDLAALHGSLDEMAEDTGTLLRQQGRINSTIQQGLMESLMVPFGRQMPRLERLIRQTAEQEGKTVQAEFEGVEAELDRNVLERITPALEHLLRNAVVHGIENPAARLAAGKPAQGTLRLVAKREGAQLLLEVRDDGRGLDFAAIRSAAIARGLLPADAQLAEDELARFIFQHGFSTAGKLTQNAGRGVGLDVVAAEIKQLGGTLELRSKTGEGMRFAIRLPLSLALSQALMVRVGGETFALPLTAIEGIARLPRVYSETQRGAPPAPFNYADRSYSVRFLADLIQQPRGVVAGRSLPAVLVRLGETVDGQERRAALVVEQLLGNQEIVTRPVGALVSAIRGVAGATILPGGEVVLILDTSTLLEQHLDIGPSQAAEHAAAVAMAELAALEGVAKCILVVDDSVTIRRVAERLLARQGYAVLTAKDGVDAMMLLQTETPDAILLDIEMPRADGFEVASFVRNTPRIAGTPIIMITSRSGDKHRARADQLGVNRYLIKPWQEDKLLAELRELLVAAEAVAA